MESWKFPRLKYPTTIHVSLQFNAFSHLSTSPVDCNRIVPTREQSMNRFIECWWSFFYAKWRILVSMIKLLLKILNSNLPSNKILWFEIKIVFQNNAKIRDSDQSWCFNFNFKPSLDVDCWSLIHQKLSWIVEIATASDFISTGKLQSLKV